MSLSDTEVAERLADLEARKAEYLAGLTEDERVECLKQWERQYVGLKEAIDGLAQMIRDHNANQ